MPVATIAFDNKSNRLDNKITNECSHGLFGNVFYADVVKHCLDFAFYTCRLSSDCVRPVSAVTIRATEFATTFRNAFLLGVLLPAPLACEFYFGIKRMIFACYSALVFVTALSGTKATAAAFEPRRDNLEVRSALFASSSDTLTWSTWLVVSLSCGVVALHSAVVVIWRYCRRRAMECFAAIVTNESHWHEKPPVGWLDVLAEGTTARQEAMTTISGCKPAVKRNVPSALVIIAHVCG